MCLKCDHRLWSLSGFVDANKRHQNDCKSLRTKTSVHRAKVENKLKETTDWDGFHVSLEDIEDTTSVEKILGSGDEKEMDC